MQLISIKTSSPQVKLPRISILLGSARVTPCSSNWLAALFWNNLSTKANWTLELTPESISKLGAIVIPTSLGESLAIRPAKSVR